MEGSKPALREIITGYRGLFSFFRRFVLIIEKLPGILFRVLVLLPGKL